MSPEGITDLETGTVLRVYKPIGWTSFDVTKKIQRLLLRKIKRQNPNPDGIQRRVRVGHAGTLDPLATGLLMICIGKETKNIDQYMGLPKTYTGAFCLGASTPSFDKETEINERFPIGSISEDSILLAARDLSGWQEQIPPLYSAIKQDGVRAYKMAREGLDTVLKSRTVYVEHFEITSIQLPYVGFKIICSKGTYIRSIARDFGKKLNNAAYLESLCRTQIGDFTIDEAITLDEIAEIFGEPLKWKELF